MSTVFKSQSIPDAPVAPTEKTEQPVVIATEKTKSNPTLDEIKTEQNRPYSTNFFNIDTQFDYLPTNVQKQLEDIDRFVEMEIKDRGWKPNVTAYERTLANIALELGTDESNVLDQIERISGFAQNLLKLNGVDEVRQQLRSKLRRLRTRKDMDAEVLKAIGRKIL